MPEAANAILITRPDPGASETATRIARLGLDPILAPASHIRLLPTHVPSAAMLAAILVTSGNAIAALTDEYHAIPLLAVGDATAERARTAGFACVRSAAGDANALAALVPRVLSPQAGALLLAAGRGQGEALATTLRQAGYRVIRRVVYAAVPEPNLASAARAALRAGRVRAALFFSAETARRFILQIRRADIAETLGLVDAISIGQPTAMALETLRWRRIRVAARPTQDDMLALLHD